MTCVFTVVPGGLVQKYSYHFTPSTTCGSTPKISIYAVRHRAARQAAGLRSLTLGVVIYLKSCDVPSVWRWVAAVITTLYLTEAQQRSVL